MSFEECDATTQRDETGNKSHLDVGFPHIKEEETNTLVVPGFVKEDEFDWKGGMKRGGGEEEEGELELARVGPKGRDEREVRE